MLTRGLIRVLSPNWVIVSAFLQKCIATFRKVLVKEKESIVGRDMNPFWKEERSGYNTIKVDKIFRGLNPLFP